MRAVVDSVLAQGWLDLPKEDEKEDGMPRPSNPNPNPNPLLAMCYLVITPTRHAL